jgi:Raf kinase inhibitor-like YbhB/YbcL family protein
MRRRSLFISVALSLAIIASPDTEADQGTPTDVRATVSTFKPKLVPATPARTGNLVVPNGFKVTVYATDLGNPRILAVDKQGRVYVSRREHGDVLLLQDNDADGRADGTPRTVATLPGAHGLAIHAGALYIATVKEVFVASILEDGTLAPPRMLIGDLPDGGQHPNRTLSFGPDGQLYISVGSTCNACNETHPEHATLLRATPDGKSRVIVASGLRNTIGFAWEPATGELWGMDHGIDFLGDDVQAEELNRIEQGKQYGWPHVFADGGINPQSTPPGGITKDEWKARSVPMTLGYTAHAAPMQMLFYSGKAFPESYRGDAFVAMRGSWNRKPASGYEVVRIDFQNGQPKAIEPFVTGFLSGSETFGRPVGIAQLPDGSLLVGDDTNGVLYRVSHGQSHSNRLVDEKVAPATAMTEQAKRGLGVDLALDRIDARSSEAISLSSSSFDDGGPIPVRHSEYADGLSPALAWKAVEGAESYALIVEDPDAKPTTPYIHWVAWNIPAGVTRLPDGLQEQLRLIRPEGMMQGPTSRGSIGYMGPRPPEGDPAHHYHFQLFALDRMLDLPIATSRDELIEAMRGHALAEGRVIGTFKAPEKRLK